MNIEQLSDLALLAWYLTQDFPTQLWPLTHKVNVCRVLLSLPIVYECHNRLKDKSPGPSHPLNLAIGSKLEIVLMEMKRAFHFDGAQQLNLVKKHFKKVLEGGSRLYEVGTLVRLIYKTATDHVFGFSKSKLGGEDGGPIRKRKVI